MTAVKKNKQIANVVSLAEGKQLIAKSSRVKHPESKLQQACVKWFRYRYPKYSLLLFAIPNGGARSKAEASIMQGEGVVPGVSDLFLAKPSMEFNGIFIEMKSGKNTLTAHQKQFIETVMQHGYKTAVCYSFDEFQGAVESYLEA